MLDETDRRILAALQQDGRASVRDVAAQAHVSRANAYARLARLEQTGVLRGYTVDIDADALGARLPAYVHVRIKQHTWKSFQDRVWALPETIHLALVSGEYDCVLLVRTTDAGHLRELVLERIQSFPEVLKTETVLVFEERGRSLAAWPQAPSDT